MRKKFRFLTVLAVCVMVLSCFSVTAFAYADDTEQNLPVTEATQPEQQPETTPTPEKPNGEPIDDEGNAYTRDLLYDKATNKQFITVQTKNGNTFFIVIDYDAPINEDEEQYQTYFLNMVDESDLLALLDEDTAAALLRHHPDGNGQCAVHVHSAAVYIGRRVCSASDDVGDQRSTFRGCTAVCGSLSASAAAHILSDTGVQWSFAGSGICCGRDAAPHSAGGRQLGNPDVQGADRSDCAAADSCSDFTAAAALEESGPKVHQIKR